MKGKFFSIGVPLSVAYANKQVDRSNLIGRWEPNAGKLAMFFPSDYKRPLTGAWSTLVRRGFLVDAGGLYLWNALFHLVILVEETLKVDRQGRLVLPSSLRERLGLKRDGGTVSFRLDGTRLILQPISENLERLVAEWREMVTGLHAEPFTEAAEQGWKWMSLEYARRKLGLC